MIIRSAQFLLSSSDVKKCPDSNKPEYAFIGRSNVGKSSLINMLMNRKGLAKISSTPGKTQLINHFEVNEEWYLVDLPGYGFAKVPKSQKKIFQKMIEDYILERPNLVNLFVLIDSRLSPQQIDLEFMQWLGDSGIPFSMVFTKLDKLKRSEIARNMKTYADKMLLVWEELPVRFLTSATDKVGGQELLDHIDHLNTDFQGKFK